MIGSDFKRIREKNGLTQEQLSGLLGVSSRIVISHYESDFRNPSHLIRTIMLALDLLPEKRAAELLDVLRKYSDRERKLK